MLNLAAMDQTTDEWQRAYQAACAEFSEKAVLSKMEDMARRGYVEYGVSARTAWLTDKGREALGRHET